MANKIKQLAKDTVIYGGTTILTRLLNWLLVPLYTYQLQDQANYGIVINLYAWTALLLVILTFGMETGFFRFSNKKEGERTVYSTSLFAVGITALLFVASVVIFIQPISRFLNYEDYKDLIYMLAGIVAVDAFVSIPFAKLRYDSRPLRFALIKVVLVGVNISMNLFFFVLCPYILKQNPSSWITLFYNPSYGVTYVFVSNVFSSAIVLIMLLPEIFKAQLLIDVKLLKRMLVYSLPILGIGIAGVINQSGDKILYPFLIKDEAKAMFQLGIYGANYKLGVIMVMFTQGFRYAFEPFIFKHHSESGSRQEYADVMKFFVIFGLLIFLGVTFFIDVVKFFISPDYHSGLHVVPIILIAHLMFGVFLNLSVWYKLTDKTHLGLILAVVGSVFTIGINIIFVPLYGYIASAWANLVCYFIMMCSSFFLMRKYFPVAYNLKVIFSYVFIAGLLYIADLKLIQETEGIKYVIKAVIILAFTGYVFKKEKLGSIFKPKVL